jgi:methylated-DNA-[protein]-cysteine S-methyltransferase
MTLEWAAIDTPVGPVSVGCGAAGVAQVRFRPPPAVAGSGGSRGAGGGSGSGGSSGSSGSSGGDSSAGGAARDLARAARRQLAEYFAGRRKEFELPLDWSSFGPAQRPVLELLYAEVGYGQTVTYGGLAGRAGVPAGPDAIPARAVGQIMGANPIPVIVPCHRVVASDGLGGYGLGGYSGGAGPEVKRWLLILEGSMPPTLDWVPAPAPEDD